MFLNGLYLENYMGIGSPPQRMFPFKRFNFFIGANNAGKSTALNFISKYLPLVKPTTYGENRQPEILPLEQHMNSGGQPIKFGIGISIEDFVRNALVAKPVLDNLQIRPLLWAIAENLADKGAIWLTSNLPFNALQLDKSFAPRQALTIINDRQWEGLWRYITGQSGGGIHQHWIPETLGNLAHFQPTSLPGTILIPAIRQIGPANQGAFNPNGSGLIDRLVEIQNPDHDRRADRVLFDKINNFLRTVTDVEDAQIDIPHNRAHVLVHMNGRVLPLTSLGTGIHEVIMLAAACVLNDEKIVCIEEPEIHLHPILQRKFIRFLQAQTESQYFIATHSASFIDTPGAAIFHVQHDRTKTSIRESILKSERYAICLDLGHRASDIVQSNAVIWVEGPSERIYLKHWISAFNPELIEGLHYSIMFYGGRLLSHLSADDSEVQAFIDLRFLNQNLAVVMDSDKKDEKDTVNDTKQRIIGEFINSRGVAWLTAGREIENYIDYNVLQAGLAEIHPRIYTGPATGGQFDHAFYFEATRQNPKPTESATYISEGADKVKLAKWVCEREANLDILDLRQRISEICQMIAAAND